ncbi:MAG: family 2 glycosyl transferase [Segetibacter sp.]|jgi:glycosyltransferase involved in cell wall biosynthesis|nr:family 2 glycosyl transferase [Segetibacter sp.]
MNSPLVSVVIPCYNVSAHVQKAVGSILTQTYTNLEIWIIDDASTDDTLSKINGFTDNRIRVIHYEENTRKVGAVNDVLKKVNGDFICFQDSDDWSEPERISLQLEQFDNDCRVGICFTNYRYVGMKKRSAGRIALSDQELRKEFIEFGNNRNFSFDPTVCPTMMISRDAVQRTGGYHPYFAGKVAEDIHWVYRILKDFKGITLDHVLYNYNLREGSFTHLQFSGKNAKYAYSWQLLSKIIYKDIYENIDVLSAENLGLLKELELQSCEEALLYNIQILNEIKFVYENSMSFKLGKSLLMPFTYLKKKMNKLFYKQDV